MTRLRRFAGPAVLVLAVAALVLTLRGEGEQARAALARTSPLSVLCAFAAVLAGLAASAQVWRVLLRELGTPTTARQAGHVFFVGQLGKYVPGSVFALAAQMSVGRRYALPRTRVATSWLLFMLVLLATGALSAAAALPLAGPVGAYGLVLLVVPVGLVCLAPPVLGRLLGLLFRLTRRPPLERPLTWRGMGAATGWALVMWAAYGLHLVLLVQPQGPAGGHRLPLLAFGGYALAWTAGLLVVVAPAGAGVREAVLVLALAPVLDVPAATTVAVLSRVLMALGDGAWAVVALLSRDTPVLPPAAVPRQGVMARVESAEN